MADVLFTNVRIFDGSGDMPYTGEVLVRATASPVSAAPATACGRRRCSGPR
jgi:hypothetical protein